MSRRRTSRQHYDVFRRDYAEGTLDDKIAGVGQQPAKKPAAKARREYLKDYLGWLWPEQWAVAVICAVLPHFNDKMYTWIEVRPCNGRNQQHDRDRPPAPKFGEPARRDG
jgi:hypothetical protein